ncbi:hypothetical protein Ga0100231_016220 [Opitutaceae bacterium TAV4]|uniref:hypothetical protein n=1 Tax=Geminisphaera colitermitum TaxID=1148786 RepID=UPI000F62BEE5|nr:hypothetical protein [Geminisphaera colitermitum]RRJ95598.1 hypothetical protein Ga0100231_016220 [Opitutaceae bacterium TAV4]RRJ99901.1 hypothetical protein Ga0100230_017935 [Opitutaceae bacterium TAV3]
MPTQRRFASSAGKMPALPGADAPELPPPPLLLSAKWIQAQRASPADAGGMPAPPMERHRHSLRALHAHDDDAHADVIEF